MRSDGERIRGGAGHVDAGPIRVEGHARRAPEGVGHRIASNPDGRHAGFVLVGGKPIRASRKSAEWCLKAVDQCWSQKGPRIRVEERGEAQRAYDAAREAYRQRLKECDVD